MRSRVLVRRPRPERHDLPPNRPQGRPLPPDDRPRGGAVPAAPRVAFVGACGPRIGRSFPPPRRISTRENSRENQAMPSLPLNRTEWGGRARAWALFVLGSLAVLALAPAPGL